MFLAVTLVLNWSGTSGFKKREVSPPTLKKMPEKRANSQDTQAQQ